MVPDLGVGAVWGDGTEAPRCPVTRRVGVAKWTSPAVLRESMGRDGRSGLRGARLMRLPSLPRIVTPTSQWWGRWECQLTSSHTGSGSTLARGGFVLACSGHV